ncbi:dihydrofolate reductase [Clostridium botulinum]|uniref:Dihydrofolate reductase n=1 Tax=Clostridium botulinum C/D str. DC5 TaxID=1443128 RepID=A0A0A0ID20_CLOBO|nr:dihydrofolate reductase [Clostridium botulinum]KEI06152.1 diacylglycerol kinase [Clostridium botulinum C/D str. BKT75002]KEI08082.1 diacylglycerol kinase [Clostridium botulinum C/D str. BKT2873]KGM98817.1 diacylglycerol kinase [Clostridium botulinum C/D str. DC5]KOC52984.1 diacylglycerol kinase [Clostridium botulinum]KOC57980.1 diacylglycerol kinase [Clostridium botulinum]
MISFVVAVDKNNLIGKNNMLPWHLPCDLNHFKEITLKESKTIIMGRKTFEALPNILPGRKHILLTRNQNYVVNNTDVEIIYNITELTKFIKSHKEYFVIGGGKIFSMLLPYATKIYMTKIKHSFDGDTFFPKLDMTEWEIVEHFNGTLNSKNIYKHAFLTLYKKAKY